MSRLKTIIFCFLIFSALGEAEAKNAFWRRFEINKPALHEEFEKLAHQIILDAQAFDPPPQDRFMEAQGDVSKNDPGTRLNDYRNLAPKVFRDLDKWLAKDPHQEVLTYAHYLALRFQGGRPVKNASLYLKHLSEKSTALGVKRFFQALSAFAYYKYSTPYAGVTESLGVKLANVRRVYFDPESILVFMGKDHRTWASSKIIADRFHSLALSTDVIQGKEPTIEQVFPLLYELKWYTWRNSSLNEWWFSKHIWTPLNSADLNSLGTYDPTALYVGDEGLSRFAEWFNSEKIWSLAVKHYWLFGADSEDEFVWHSRDAKEFLDGIKHSIDTKSMWWN